ncbi:AraC family transcriptional regulator [Flavobacterium branchiarum]|uniref:AraC family transcriptional regulator n=1 Tax=Flavobacterium branchiarum TaxID=1114870 RepID=A0ABV5FJX5_9FLAO|nr:AraC family transcriptional regulator [Flavobacterium branchiarum]MDN3672464.1 AraC family transcriptional regulator [Flavobacterium branchiarum]
MKKKNIHAPYEILIEKVDECPLRDVEFNYFQIVYVVSGNGRQWVDNRVTPYAAGDMFLLTPMSKYSFDVDTTTEFLLIKFNNIYIHDKKIGLDNIQRLEFILNNAELNIGCVLNRQSDRQVVGTIAEIMRNEIANETIYGKDLIQQLMNTLIVLVARNMVVDLPDGIKETTDKKITKILQYIQTNIYSPNQLRIAIISEKFNFSETYLSRYFKKHTGETLQQYITNYRIQLIEKRLLYSDMRIGEIAFELGFSDETHLSKFFKKSKIMNPSLFRKKGRIK